MTYDPVTYWTERARRKGPSYVGPGSRPDLAAAEARVFSRWLRAAVEPVDFLLDFGCGTGRLTPALRQRCATYFGVDIVPGAVELADERFDCAPELFFLAVHPPALPFETGMFDAAVASVVFQHVPEDDVALVLEELDRVLDADAPVYVIDANPEVVVEPHEHVFPRDPEKIARGLFRSIARGPVARGEHLFYVLR